MNGEWMRFLEEIIPFSRLGWSLVHFVWQGAIIGLIVLGARSLLANQSAQLRRGVALVLTVVALMCPLGTYMVLRSLDQPAESKKENGSLVSNPEPIRNEKRGRTDGRRTQAVRIPFTRPEIPRSNVPSSPESHELPRTGVARDVPGAYQYQNPQAPPTPVETKSGGSFNENRWLWWVVLAWVVGVVCLTLRQFGGWWITWSWRRSAKAAPISWQRCVDRILEHHESRRRLRVLSCVKVPSLVLAGVLRPVILVPSAIMAGLPARQFEALLAHEVAHFLRRDHWVTLLVALAETLLFYHPAVWLLTKWVREERENCADDSAVALCGDRVTYANALASLADLAESPTGIAASGGDLTNRVRRLLGSEVSAGGHWSMTPWLVILLGFLAMMLGRHGHADDPVEITPMTKRWDFSAEGKPAIGLDGTVYVGGEKSIFALDPATKRILWRFRPPVFDDFSHASWRTPVAGPEGTLLAVQGKSHGGPWWDDVYALEAATGEVRWSISGWASGTNFVISGDGTVYTTARPFEESVLMALEGETGDIRWERALEGSYRAPMIGPDGRLYVEALDAEQDNRPYTGVFDTQTGQLLDRMDCRLPYFTRDGLALVLDTPVRAIDWHSGQTLWHTNIGSRDHVSLGDLIDGENGLVYVITSQHIHALEMTTGKERWRRVVSTLGPSVRPRLGLAEAGILYSTTIDGVAGFDALTGEQVFAGRHPGGLSSELVYASDSVLYLSSVKRLTAMDAISPPRLSSPSASNHRNHERWGTPEILSMTEALALVEGGSGRLSVLAAGDALKYQWFFKGDPIDGATGAFHEIESFSQEVAGDYHVKVSNDSGLIEGGTIPVRLGIPLTIQIEGPGQVTLDPPGGVYVPGTIVTATAVPEQDEGFIGWSGALANATPSIAITVDQPKQLTASFEVLPGSVLWQTTIDGPPSPRANRLAIGPNDTIYLWISEIINSQVEATVHAVDPDGQIRWTSESFRWGGIDFGQMAAGNDALLYLATNGSIIALDVETGVRRWTTSGLEPTSRNGLAVSNNGVVITANGLPTFVDRGREVGVAVNGKTGEVLWHFEAPNPSGPPAYAIGNDETIYVASKRLSALDGTNGVTGWTAEDLPTPPDSPAYELVFQYTNAALGASSLYAMSTGLIENNSRLTICHALDAQTGLRQWSYEVRQDFARIEGQLAVSADEVVYFPAGNQLVALDGRTGEALWELEELGPVTSPVIGNAGTVYAAAGNQVMALRPRSGEVLWTYEIPGPEPVSSMVLDSDGTLYLLAGRTLFALETSVSARPQWPSESGAVPYRRSIQR